MPLAAQDAPSQAPVSQQPVPIRSYDDWATMQELNCRAALREMWKQGNAADEQLRQLKEDKQKLEAELKALKEKPSAPPDKTK